MRSCIVMRVVAAGMLYLVVVGGPAEAQQIAGGRLFEPRAKVYRARVVPQWYAGGQKFWYRNDLALGKREFIAVDCVQGVRKTAFDHAKLASALNDAGEKVTAERLPLEEVQFADAGDGLQFRVGKQAYEYHLLREELTKVVEQDREAKAAGPVENATEVFPLRSRNGGDETELTFVNRTQGEVELFWVDTNGQRRSYGKLAVGASKTQHTYVGHVWDVNNMDGGTVGRFAASETLTNAVIDGRAEHIRVAETNRTAEQRRENRGDRGGRSPDGRWTAEIVDHNVVLRSTAERAEQKLTYDGEEGKAYGMLRWAPDSQTLVAFRIIVAERKPVHLVESSPAGGGRAVLHTRPYALPGDAMTSYELRLFCTEAKAAVACDAEPITFGTPRIRFGNGGRTLRYEQVDRGHQRFRLVEVNCRTGSTRSLIDERAATFIWTAHDESAGVRRVTWLEGSEEIVYASERDGWRHLYLVDAREGAIQGQITQGNFVVRGIDHIDEERRQIWFRASGRNDGEDPYFVHHYRVSFDGTDLVTLTAGNGTHSVQFSPQRDYLIDTYSRVEQAPISDLRRASDGRLICRLEEADTAEIQESGWQAPEVFTAKGRDGSTDICGIICRPRDFDPAKQYPVIEQIYAGPQGAFVPKSFSSERRFAALTDLGFVVVQIDGMGTAHRSKAFHDVCWQNLKDAGLPDRILWHQAVASKYSWYDISRVGIYGTSAGGQNSTGAVLFHPEFYKVAVSACGCHDNRMDKASWNEQWMGYPVGPHYAANSNIENAGKLQGKLLLIVGEMDTNVPPESTLRLADALIRAGKDFELLVVPGGGHGMGGVYGTRRMQDFFVRHLLGREPPNRNASGQ